MLPRLLIEHCFAGLLGLQGSVQHDEFHRKRNVIAMDFRWLRYQCRPFLKGLTVPHCCCSTHCCTCVLSHVCSSLIPQVQRTYNNSNGDNIVELSPVVLVKDGVLVFVILGLALLA